MVVVLGHLGFRQVNEGTRRCRCSQGFLDVETPTRHDLPGKTGQHIDILEDFILHVQIAEVGIVRHHQSGSSGHVRSRHRSATEGFVASVRVGAENLDARCSQIDPIAKIREIGEQVVVIGGGDRDNVGQAVSGRVVQRTEAVIAGRRDKQRAGVLNGVLQGLRARAAAP